MRNARIFQKKFLVFKKGIQKAEVEICDVYVLLCRILQLECNPSTGR